jgi:hypothetical protein
MESAPSGDDPFPVRFFALPLLLAMLGLAFHLRYDPRMALAMTIAFVLLGLGVVVVANLQEPEIRDRDYLFVGAFTVVAVWSGLGAAGLAALRREGDVSGRGLVAPAVGLLCLLAVPIPMLLGGWTHHQRSTDWVAWDYAYNLLQSCEQDAILFTAGDNDTFPVLYLQSVDGVRRDVRVINLAMANDLSYLDRVRSEPAWGRPPVPLGIPDSILGDTLVRVAMPEMVTLQTGDRKKGRRGDTAAAMRWVLRGPAVGEEGLQMIRLKVCRRPIAPGSTST